jgi:transcriptional regulator with XRE-family HTH domain
VLVNGYTTGLIKEGNVLMGTDEPWLTTWATIEKGFNTSLLAELLKDYRQSNGLNQADLAAVLNLDQSYVSKIETGHRQVRDLDTLLHIAHRLNIAPSHLGLSRETLRPVRQPATAVLADTSDPVEASKAEWCRTRRYLNRHRGDLAKVALTLYRPEFRAGSTTFLTKLAWMPTRPIALDAIELEWSVRVPPVIVTGTEPEAHATLPLWAPGHRFNRYTAAIRYLDAPSLFENRASYRLLDLELSGDSPRMTFCLGTYFDKLDATEAAAHELARVVRSAGSSTATPNLAELPLRAFIGDPFDPERRAIMPAIETLTLRRKRASGEASFLLHWRDPAKVATAAGIYGLIPAGEFQPSSVATWDRANDFSLWRNMVREYSEEILGEPERDGSGGEPINYDGWDFYKQFDQARQDERVTVYCLGMGLDSLTLTATILTVVVIDDDVFDDLFGKAVQVNAEGALVTTVDASAVTDGLPFTASAVRRLLTSEPIASPGACILDLAWRHRDSILGRA